MSIKDIFVKDIGREINPVIKVSDVDEEATIFQELDEYVVTNEIDKNFDKLYKGITEGLKGNKDHMGVWISGDFGSGKSHFLKIVSFLLKNRNVCGKDSVEYLRDKVSPGVYQMMQAVGRRDIDTILFDIDAKSKNGKDEDGMVRTFASVFNELLGLSSVLSVAELERYLISIDKYDSFKESYRKVSNNHRSWDENVMTQIQEDGSSITVRGGGDRDEPSFVQGSIIKALLDCGAYSDEDEAKSVASKTEEISEISPENFAKRVGEYCRSRGSGYTLFFLVDEVGQFISGNVQKMLRLQTIVQELGVKAAGQAWVIVTSQEDVDAIVQDVSNNDFSKIQGRFSIRIKTVSSDVKEVIEKRVLEKKPDYEQSLSALYEESGVDIRNKFSLDNRMTIRLYRDAREFADTYPFIPYQYDMLQVMLTQLRNKSNAGKNLSNAARSMLLIFKEAANAYGDYDVGAIVPLYGFLTKTIQDELDQPTRILFGRAHDNPDLNDFDMNVLKTLFLVKYYDGLDTNLGNIAALMMSSLEDNRLDLKSEIEKSLNRLIDQNFVQRSGDIYIFLTDQEQEVNREIQRETVDLSTLHSKISDVAFGEIFKVSTKYNYDSNHSYPFNRVIDGENMGNTNHELFVYIKTPRNKVAPILVSGLSQSGVLFDLPDDKHVVDMFSEIIRTEAYIRKTSGTTISTQQQDVINLRKAELTQMKERAKGALETALQNSTIYVNNNQVNISDSLSPDKRLDDSMRILVQSVYNKMDYIKKSRKVDDIKTLFYSPTVTPFDECVEGFENAVNDLQDYLRIISSEKATVTIKNVVDKYSKKPYGFSVVDIEWMLALLFRQGRIDIIYDGNEYRGQTINSKLAVTIFTNKSNHERTRIAVRESITAEQINRAKTVYNYLFKMPLQVDESNIVKFVNRSANDMLKNIDGLIGRYNSEHRYPGKGRLDEIRPTIVRLCNIQSPDLFKFTDSNEDQLRKIHLDYNNISDFFRPDSSRKMIFDRALAVLGSYDRDKAYLGPEVTETIEKISEVISSDSGKISELNPLCSKYESISKEMTESYRKENVDRLMGELNSLREEHSDDAEFYEDLGKEIDYVTKILSEATTISEIKDAVEGSRSRIANKLRDLQSQQSSSHVTEISGSTPSAASTSEASSMTVSVRKRITATSMIQKKNVECEEDVDEIIDTLRSKLMDKLKDGPFDIMW